MTKEKIDVVIELLNKLEERMNRLENLLFTVEVPNSDLQAKKSEGVIDRKESFMEFFRKHNPKSDTDKTLVIMYFLELNRALKNITTKNISEGFREVREKVPTNVADKVQLLHKKSLIMPAESVEGMNGWMITQSGLDYLGDLKKNE